MLDELPLRSSMLVLAVAFQLVRWPTRHLTGCKAAWEAMKKNPQDGIVLSGCSVLWIACVILYVGCHPWLSQWQFEAPAVVRWLGVALGIGAVALTRWADSTMGENLCIIVQLKTDQTLVTEGPYRWIRHPIYAGTILFALMLILVSCNTLVLLGAGTAAGLLLGTRILQEERMLTERFGDQYREYVRSTGRLLPRLFRPARPVQRPKGVFLVRRGKRAERAESRELMAEADVPSADGAKRWQIRNSEVREC